MKIKPTFWQRVRARWGRGKKPVPAAVDKSELYRQGVRKKVYDAIMLTLGARLAVADGAIGKEEMRLFAGLLPVMNGQGANLLAESANDNEPLERYAQRIARFFPGQPGLRREIVQTLFDLAAADGPINPQEMLFLRGVMRAFGMPESEFVRSLEKYMDPPSSHQLLAIEPHAGYPQLKRAYMQAVQAYHPDALTAAGMPEAVIELANRRLERITQAYQAIKRRRKFSA